MIDDAQRWDIIHQKTLKETEWHSLYAEEKEKLFPRNCMVVDLGAGTGSDAIYFLKKGHSVVALDISEFALNILRQKAKNENVAGRLVASQMDLNLHTIPIKDTSVDVVYSRISINYFGAKQTAKIFTDIYRILKPGGKAYLTLKSPEDKVEMEYLTKSSVLYEPNVFIEGGMLRSRFSKEQLEEILRTTGIPGFEVKPYQENLSGRKEGHHPVLFVNEVVFGKS